METYGKHMETIGGSTTLSCPRAGQNTLYHNMKMNIFNGRVRCQILLIQTRHLSPTMILRGGPAENIIKPYVFEGAPLGPERNPQARGIQLSGDPQNLINSQEPL